MFKTFKVSVPTKDGVVEALVHAQFDNNPNDAGELPRSGHPPYEPRLRVTTASPNGTVTAIDVDVLAITGPVTFTDNND